MTFNNKHYIPEKQILVKALEATNTGIVITDNLLPDNPIIYCNPAFERIAGYSREEIIGHNCRFLQQKDRNQQARFEVKEAIVKGQDCVVQIRNYNKSGELFYNELYLSAIKNQQGQVTHFIGVQNDITARKKAEQNLEMTLQETERKVSNRTELL